MKRVTVTELKNKLSQYLRMVKRGETVEVLEHSVPIARLQGLGEGPVETGEALRRLARDGIVSLAKKSADRELLECPAVPCDADPAKLLVEERGDR